MNLSQNNSMMMPNNRLSAPLIKKSHGSHHDKLVAAAQKFVAQAFFEPFLKSARENPFHNNRFNGGKGADTMASLQDESLASAMASGLKSKSGPIHTKDGDKTGNSLVDSLVKRLEAKSAYDKHTDAWINTQRDSAGHVKLQQGQSKPIHGSTHVAAVI